MKLRSSFALVLAFGTLLAASAGTVSLHVDAAPNVYGSPNYAPWWSATQEAVSNGTFVNMGNSVNPANAGTARLEIQDAVVYSFGDLGRRLSFVYWVPDETLETLKAKNFQIGMEYVWDGVAHDFYNDYYGATWLTPTKWEAYNGGVIGVAGFAWWGAYGVNTQAALDADLAAWAPHQGDITLSVKMDDRKVASLTAKYHVPDGGTTVLMLGAVFLVFGCLRRRMAR